MHKVHVFTYSRAIIKAHICHWTRVRVGSRGQGAGNRKPGPGTGSHSREQGASRSQWQYELPRSGGPGAGSADRSGSESGGVSAPPVGFVGRRITSPPRTVRHRAERMTRVTPHPPRPPREPTEVRSSPHPSALCRFCLRPSKRDPARSVPSKYPSAIPEGGFDGRNRPGRPRTVANRVETAPTGAMRTGNRSPLPHAPVVTGIQCMWRALSALVLRLAGQVIKIPLQCVLYLTLNWISGDIAVSGIAPILGMR